VDASGVPEFSSRYAGGFIATAAEMTDFDAWMLKNGACLRQKISTGRGGIGEAIRRYWRGGGSALVVEADLMVE
jgi:hypothetical protein